MISDVIRIKHIDPIIDMLNKSLFMWKIFIEHLNPAFRRFEPSLDIVSDIPEYYSSLNPKFLCSSVPWPPHPQLPSLAFLHIFIPNS